MLKGCMVMSNQRGSVIIFSYLLLGFLVIWGATSFRRGALEVTNSERYARTAKAFHMADAGTDWAMDELRADRAWGGSGYTALGGTGGYQVAVATLSPTLRQLTSTGHVPSNLTTAPGYQRRQIEAVVSLSDPTPFEDAVFADSKITVESNTIVDSYDSSLGPYGGTNIGQAGDVGSNAIGAGTITVRSNAQVHGDAAVGPGGNPSTDIILDSNAQITGSSGAISQPKDLTPATFSSGTATTSLVLGGNATQTLGAGTHRFTRVELDSNAAVLISGDVTLFVEESFRLLSNAQFVTSCAGCTITIYVRGLVDPLQPSLPPAVELESNTVLSAGGVPSRLQVYVTGDGTAARSVEVRSNSGLYGVVHAPHSTFHLDSNAVLYGAVIASEATLDSDALLHYDTALEHLVIPTLFVRLLSWREL